jgi:hypothetical protein
MDLNREVIHFQYQSFELRIIVSKPGADTTLSAPGLGSAI